MYTLGGKHYNMVKIQITQDKQVKANAYCALNFNYKRYTCVVMCAQDNMTINSTNNHILQNP